MKLNREKKINFIGRQQFFSSFLLAEKVYKVALMKAEELETSLADCVVTFGVEERFAIGSNPNAILFPIGALENLCIINSQKTEQNSIFSGQVYASAVSQHELGS